MFKQGVFLVHIFLYSDGVQTFKKHPPELFHKKGALKNFAKFKGKHLCQSLLFYKIADLRPATLLKKSLWYRCFLVNSEKF